MKDGFHRGRSLKLFATGSVCEGLGNVGTGPRGGGEIGAGGTAQKDCLAGGLSAGLSGFEGCLQIRPRSYRIEK